MEIAESPSDEQYIDNMFKKNEATESHNLDRYNFPLQSSSSKSTQQFFKSDPHNPDQHIPIIQKHSSSKENQMNLKNCSFAMPTASFTLKMKHPPKKFEELSAISCSSASSMGRKTKRNPVIAVAKIKAYDRYINESLGDLAAAPEVNRRHSLEVKRKCRPCNTFVDKRELANIISMRQLSSASSSFIPNTNFKGRGFESRNLEDTSAIPFADSNIEVEFSEAKVKKVDTCNEEIEEHSFMKNSAEAVSYTHLTLPTNREV
eukprot:TRINITY_DN8458_c0_g1_i15.p1 TRINITY_DN8458_c0_g1~~TRINITY_DN8458_c0_g1_i15.p1  ORF type:complete len:261 (-),score=42.45 TRINITY_DN8458_c0_g1_i15:49-831(-)